MTIPRPEVNEYGPFYATYVKKTENTDWSAQMTAAFDELQSLLSPLTEAQWNFRYGPDKWTIKELVLHVIDSERIFAYRALCFARGDTTSLPGFDENRYAKTGRASSRTGRSLLDELRNVRAATMALFENVSDDLWLQTGVANGLPMSLRAQAYVLLGHFKHHLTILKERYLNALR